MESDPKRVVAPMRVKAWQIQLDGTGRRALADDNVELIILHGRIQDFLNQFVEAMNFVDKKDIAVFEISEDRAQVSYLLNSWT